MAMRARIIRPAISLDLDNACGEMPMNELTAQELWRSRERVQLEPIPIACQAHGLPAHAR